MKGIDKKKLIRIVSICVIALVPVLTALSVYVNINYIDQSTGFSIDGSYVPTVFNVSMLVLVIGLFVISLFYKIKLKDNGAFKTPSETENDTSDIKTDEANRENGTDEIAETEKAAEKNENGSEEIKSEENKAPKPLTTGAKLVIINDNPLSVFAAALTGFMFLSAFILELTGRFSGETSGVLEFIILAFTAINGIFFIYASASKNAYPHKFMFSLLYGAAPIWGGLRLIDAFLKQRNMVKLEPSFFTLMTCISIMFFFYNEGAFTLTDASHQNLNRYFFFGQCTILFTALHSLTNIILSCFWINGFGAETIFSIIESVIGLYACIKLITISKKIEKGDYTEE